MSEMNVTPATEAASSETQDFLSSVGESEKRVRVSGKAVSDEVVLSTKDVNVYYGDHHALHNTSLDFHKGEITALIGPSGCGKSTTLRMIAGLEEITEGELYIGDKLMNDVAPKNRDIAMVFQNYALYPHMTVYENMAFSLKLKKCSKEEIDKRVREAAHILNLSLIHI